MMINSLQIKNFRSLEDFNVRKVGNVNLIVGKNNSGKSTVLEALRIYAGNANQSLLIKIAEGHDEKYLLNEEQGQQDIFDDTTLPFEDLFTGRTFPSSEEGIVIGEIENKDSQLTIVYGHLIKEVITSKDEETGEETTRINRRVVIDKSESNDIDDDSSGILIVTKGNQGV